MISVRFAPSPTGMLHLGGARTALFNWLWARQQQGNFLLRLEDTDTERSSAVYAQDILDSLTWLGLTWDGPVMVQSTRHHHHKTLALTLLAHDKAYWCHQPPKKSDTDLVDYAPLQPALRLKNSGHQGVCTITDLVLGEVSQNLDDLDDMVILRSDGTPTYMLAVVVDDHDMGVTTVLRGMDHLTNTFRQRRVYDAFGWTPPQYGHFPLIHDAAGTKLSKRRGAKSVSEYRTEGYLPEALINTLLRLGWGCGNTELFSQQEALQLFTLDRISVSSARFDADKLMHWNAHYLRSLNPQEAWQRLTAWAHHAGHNPLVLQEVTLQHVEEWMPVFQERCLTLLQLYTTLAALQEATPPVPLPWTEEEREILRLFLKEWPWADRAASLEVKIRAWTTQHHILLKHMAQLLRRALTGQSVSPPLFHVMTFMGEEQVKHRLQGVIQKAFDV